MASLVVGMVLVLLGTVCISAGVAVAVVEAFRPAPAAAGAFPSVKDLTRLGKVIAEILGQFGKLRPGAQLLVAGLAQFGLGIWLLTSRPF